MQEYLAFREPVNPQLGIHQYFPIRLYRLRWDVPSSRIIGQAEIAGWTVG
jgi:hypothetical protein